MVNNEIFVLGHGERTTDSHEVHQRITGAEFNEDGGVKRFIFTDAPGHVEISDQGLIQTSMAVSFLVNKDIQLVGVGCAPKFTQTPEVIQYHFIGVPVIEDNIFGDNISFVRRGKKVVAVDGGGKVIPGYREKREPPQYYWDYLDNDFDPRVPGNKLVCAGAQFLRRLLGRDEIRGTMACVYAIDLAQRTIKRVVKMGRVIKRPVLLYPSF